MSNRNPRRIAAADLREGNVLVMPAGQPDQYVAHVTFLRSAPDAVIVTTLAGDARLDRADRVTVR